MSIELKPIAKNVFLVKTTYLSKLAHMNILNLTELAFFGANVLMAFELIQLTYTPHRYQMI